MKKLFAAILLVLLFAIQAFAAGSCTFAADSDSKVAQLTWVCTSDASGNVSAPTITGAGYNAAYSGRIDTVTVKPGAGADAPSTTFAVKLNPSTDSTIDRLGNMAASCSTTLSKWGMPLDPVNSGPVKVFKEILVPFASSVGNTKQFTLKVVIAK